METIEQLHSKEMNEWGVKPKEKKKKCTTCKKKVIKELDPIIEEIYIPTVDEVKLAYYELTDMSGVKEEKKPFISQVYKSIFNEELDFGCGSCASIQARKLQAYITNTLNIKL